MLDLTPRPTEYRGVQYRSKCEAMFALWLELRNSTDTRIFYEPEWAEIDDYVPDFSVHSPQELSEDESPFVMFSTGVELIEYKPSRPTFSCVDRVAEKLRRISKTSLQGVSGIVYIGLSIYWGSVYSTDRGRITIYPDQISFSRHNWITTYERKIREYRFDLQEQEQ